MEVKEQHKKIPIRKNKSYIRILGSRLYVGSTNLCEDIGIVMRPTKENLDQIIHDHELEPLPNRAHEITGRVMRQNEERYRDILENMEEGYFELDLKGTFTFVNNAACTLMGYEYDELIGVNYKTYTSPETAQHMFEVFNRIFETGKSEIMVDYEVIRKDGSVWIHEMNASLLRDTSGQPMGFQALVWDLMESKRKEDVVRKREERYRNILDSMVEAYFEVDLKGNLTFFNSTAVKRLGYSNEEMMGMNFHQFVDDENAKKVFDAFHKVFLTGETIKAFEWEFINKHGEKIAVESSVSLQRDENGSPIGFRGVVHDITDRKKAEAAQRESEEKYRSHFSLTNDVLYVLDTELRVADVSPSVEKALGYKLEDLLGKTFLELNVLHPDDYEKAASDALWVLSGETIFSSRYRFFAKDGSLRYGEISGVPLMKDGHVTGVISVGRDITDRILAEESLRKSEERYRTILDAMKEGYFEVDLKGGFTFVNDAACALMGYEYDELVGMNYRRYYSPETAQQMYQVYSRIFKTGKPEFLMDYEIIRKDGSVRTHQANAILWQDEAGRPKGFRVLARDMTERKHAEEELRKSEERYRTIFENTGNASLLFEEDTIILLANSNFEKLTGYSKQEVEGKMSWTSFVSPEDLEKMKEYHVKRRTEPGSVPEAYEFRAINRNGETIDVFMNIALIPGTKVSIASIMDITDRKRSEKALQESEERFRDLASLLPETVFETDKGGRFTFLNQSSLEHFGYSQDEISRGINFLDVIVPEDHEKVVLNYFKYIKGENIGLNEYTARKRDGSTFPVMAHSTLVYHNGEPAGLRGFLIDITEKKNVEQQLMRVQKMESIGTLAGGIAHDFNNLLMGILGNVSLVLMNLGESHPLFDRLKTVEEYVQRGSDLTKQLLGFAQGGKYEVKPTDLGEFVRKSSEMFGRTKKEISIHLKDPKGLWTVELDRGQMDQVLLNLFVNAWQAMPDGGDMYISVENVELDEMYVRPYEVKPGKFVKLTITDMGIGMDEATKARIFEPFFTTKERGRGTGLGLASVYGIIKNHGGFIYVESEKDLGTSFMIHLPASGKHVIEEYAESDKVPKGHETVLLIDDEEMILDVGTELLKGLGYKVLKARGGREGLQIFEQKKYAINLVILDMIMPGFSGKETFDSLKRVDPCVKVLLSSGYSLDGQAKEIIQNGCNGFIQKPFSLGELAKKIRGILDE